MYMYSVSVSDRISVCALAGGISAYASAVGSVCALLMGSVHVLLVGSVRTSGGPLHDVMLAKIWQSCSDPVAKEH